MKKIFPFLLLIFFFAGCRHIEFRTGNIQQPSQLVRFYLKNIYQQRYQKEAYECYTDRVRNEISYRSFITLLRNEIPESFSDTANIRTSVTVLEGYSISSEHRIVYALLSISYPYSLVDKDIYKLVRIHCYKQLNQWMLEPYIDKESFKIRLVPAITSDYLRRLKKDKLAQLITNDLHQYKNQKPSETEKEGDTAITVTKLKIPDMTKEIEVTEPEEKEIDFSKKIETLISTGKLYFQTGEIDLAADSFQKVLEYDKENKTAKQYLKKCQMLRQLREEKQEQIRLYEKLLELEERKTKEKKPEQE